MTREAFALAVLSASTRTARTTPHVSDINAPHLLRSTYECHKRLVPAGSKFRTRTKLGMPKKQSRIRPRALLPRDYGVPSYAFGVKDAIRFEVPEGGEVHSMRAAFVQHHIAVTLVLRAQTGTGPGARLGRLFGFSRQHWSDCLAGRSWMREDTLVAAYAMHLRILDGLPGPVETSQMEQ